MNACIQDKLDFSIFIFQFNFFHGFASSGRYAFAMIAYFAQFPTFSLGYSSEGLFPSKEGVQGKRRSKLWPTKWWVRNLKLVEPSETSRNSEGYWILCSLALQRRFDCS